MNFLKRKFPQIYRFFSAKNTRRWFRRIEKTLLWLLLASLFSFNHQANAEHRTRTVIPTILLLSNPYAFYPHLQAATTLWTIGARKEAHKELALAQELWNPNILGAATPPSKLAAEWEAQDRKRIADFQFWKLQAKEKPRWRDAHILVAQLALELGERKEAQEHLDAAYQLDPDHDAVKKLQAILESRSQ